MFGKRKTLMKVFLPILSCILRGQHVVVAFVVVVASLVCVLNSSAGTWKNAENVCADNVQESKYTKQNKASNRYSHEYRKPRSMKRENKREQPFKCRGESADRSVRKRAPREYRKFVQARAQAQNHLTLLVSMFIWFDYECFVIYKRRRKQTWIRK